MAALLTLSEIREHVETCLVDDALQRIINSADDDIIARLGVLASETEVLAGRGETYLHLVRKATAITSASERFEDSISGVSTTTLVANDYNLLDDGFRVERLLTGTNAASGWRGQVTITYTPADDTTRREQLLIDLVKLAVGFSGLDSESMGGMSYKGLDYTAEREKLFISARHGRRLLT